MKASEIREQFLSFFREREHTIVPSAPMVIKNDPTLMFTNAGMNQFKDIFLGNEAATHHRVANSQKCLRVSGKHNDLEEVGLDTYHHTMFEMLGNWSFGDYFKEEAIGWAWEFLTERLGIEGDRLYATIFEGDPGDGVPRDDESERYWKKYLGSYDNHILEGSKKDNFWEMGETGPCGPCSEVHIDMRSDEERKAIPGHQLVNSDHPHVIEIWNLVFIQYNRRSNGDLEPLPDKHVDTGMGFERLCMVIQGKKSNYDTDLFQPLLKASAEVTGKPYGEREEWDIAHRVIADHLRTAAFSVADGQLPSNNRAGYVIRRILRRAVRYGYTSLGMSEPFIYRLMPALVETMGDHYPELPAQQETISRVIRQEEHSFLRTLGKGIRMIERRIAQLKEEGNIVLPGHDAFVLFDTYGFPADLTQLILRENGLTLDEEGYARELAEQKERSRDDAAFSAGDWVVIRDTETTLFTGYDHTEDEVLIARYRKVTSHGRDTIQLVFDRTPFYAEAGGQAGDKGYIEGEGETIAISDTVKENNLIIHIAEKLPDDPSASFRAVVDGMARQETANNHTATHLMHHALREVLGSHVEQKGSLVTPERLRFDFTHYSQLSDEELAAVEEMVNNMIMQNLHSEVHDDTPMEEAMAMGAIALFGEKYGERVRVISFGDSVELCGGTHVDQTARIGLFKIVSEGAIAAGVRRIEAVTGRIAIRYLNEKLQIVNEITSLLKTSGNPVAGVTRLLEENAQLRSSLAEMVQAAAAAARSELTAQAEETGNGRIYSGVLEKTSPETLKTITHQIRQSDQRSIIIIGSEYEGKAALVVGLGDKCVAAGTLNAATIIRAVAGEIGGGGGGQPFLATAGGKRPEGLPEAIARAVTMARERTG